MSFNNLEFEFDGHKSSEFPVYIVHMDSGMVGTTIGGSKSLKYDKTAYSDDIKYYYTELDNMEFSITVSPLEGYWTEDFKFEIFKWLNTRQPKAFRTTDFMGKLCYCICTNAPELMQVCYSQGNVGYIELNFVATTPYWLSDPIVVQDDLTDVTVPYTFTLENKSNVKDAKTNEFYYYPIMEFELVGTATSITLQNLSDAGRITSFTSLSTGEYLKMDNKSLEIESSTGLYRIGAWNKNRFRLVYGINQIKISEKCKYKFTMQFPVYI